MIEFRKVFNGAVIGFILMIREVRKSKIYFSRIIFKKKQKQLYEEI